MQGRAPRRDKLRDRALQGLADPLDVAQEPLLHQHRRLFREALDHSRSRCIRLDLERILAFQLQEKGDLLKDGCYVTLRHGWELNTFPKRRWPTIPDLASVLALEITSLRAAKPRSNPLLTWASRSLATFATT